MTSQPTRFFIGIGVLALLACDALAQAPQTESCATIRQQIQAQTGILSKPDTAMLEKINAHPECAFTMPEVHRAAFGDRPMVKDTHSSRRDSGHDEDEDDD